MKKDVKTPQIKPKKKRPLLPGQKKHATIKEALASILETMEAMHINELGKLKK